MPADADGAGPPPCGGWIHRRVVTRYVIANDTFSTGTFPVRSLWGNAFNGGAGGCVLSYP